MSVIHWWALFVTLFPIASAIYFYSVKQSHAASLKKLWIRAFSLSLSKPKSRKKRK